MKISNVGGFSITESRVDLLQNIMYGCGQITCQKFSQKKRQLIILV